MGKNYIKCIFLKEKVLVGTVSKYGVFIPVLMFDELVLYCVVEPPAVILTAIVF